MTESNETEEMYLLREHFDEAHYTAANPDVVAAGMDPFDHYVTVGWREGRAPNDWFLMQTWLEHHPELADDDENPFLHLLRQSTKTQVPPQLYFADATAPPEAASPRALAEFQGVFDTTYYLSLYPDLIVAQANPLEHYLNHGWREGRRPNNWFDPDMWQAKFPQVDWSQVNPLVHFVEWRNNQAAGLAEAISLLDNKFLFHSGLLWNTEEGAHPVIISGTPPSKADLALLEQRFDAAYYLETNPDLAATGVDPLLHFATLGWIEMRDPTPDFSLSYYLKNNRDIMQQRVNPFLHYVKHGHNEAWRRWATVAEARIVAEFEDPNSAMAARVAEAKALEPMVGHPTQEARRATSPTINNWKMGDVATAIRQALNGSRYRYVVAVPHVRMSGASRVASIFARTLAEIRDPRDILVLMTDSSEAEYIDWMPSDIDRFDLSAHLRGVDDENRSRFLIDVLRGIGCQTLINANSRLVWDSLQVFGRQISSEFNILTYMFTWDETASRDRVGYPIQWLRETASHHHCLLTDTKALARDIETRFGYDRFDGGTHIVPLYTPISETAAPTAAAPADRDPARFLWAGRFDAQKRLDILIDIARANSGYNFDVYGKPVLDQRDLGDFDPPGNVTARGTYRELGEVLETPYSGFVYTSQWDGIPTIVLDLAIAGVPIVAPNVGGLAEVIDNTTGWLVEDFTDVKAYGRALKEMAENPADAKARATRLKQRVASQFSAEAYRDAIQTLLDEHGY